MGPAGRASFFAHQQESGMWNTEPLLRGILANTSLAQWGVETRLLGYCWGKLYRAEILQNCRFPEEVALREDTCFTLQAVAAARRLGFLPDIDYRYTLRATPYRPEAEGLVTAYLAYYRSFISNQKIDLEPEYNIAALYGYMEYIKMAALHRDAPGNRAVQIQLIKSSFFREPWSSAFAKVDPYILPFQYRLLRSAFLHRWPEGIHLLHRLNAMRL